MDFSGNAPVINQQEDYQGGMESRSFAPSGAHVLPIPPDAAAEPAPLPPAGQNEIPIPMPQDMTPMDTDPDLPKDSNLFDPLLEKGSPAAERPLDPVSYEIPLLPPLPVPDHTSSGKRVALPYPK